MLFTDSDIISATILAAIDSEVSAAAQAAKPAIQLDGAGSICELAWQECGRKMLKAMQTYVSYPGQSGMPASHLAAVFNTGVPSRTSSRVMLNQIVATESRYASMRSPIEQWVAYHALYLLFRDASSRFKQDRYQDKAERYEQVAREMWHNLRAEGLPMIYRPLEAPGAKHGFNPGTWGTANVTGVAGSATGNVNVQVAVTYCDSSKYTSQSATGNGESAPSSILNYQIPASQVLHVDITSLVPPTGDPDPLGTSQGTVTPLNATHWNLWVGQGTGVLYLAAELIPIATKTHTHAADPVFSGSILRNGQYPDLMLVFQNIAMRG